MNDGLHKRRGRRYNRENIDIESRGSSVCLGVFERHTYYYGYVVFNHASKVHQTSR